MASSPAPPMPPPTINPDYNKLTRGHSCVLCQQRKVRCDKQKPCANCVKANKPCKVIPPLPPRRRKKSKPEERDLVDRLRKYENLLSQHGVDFDPLVPDIRPSGDRGEDVADLENDMSGLRTSPTSTASPEHGQERQKWFPYSKDYRATDDMMQDSSDEEFEGKTLHQAFDDMFKSNDGFPFMLGGTKASVTDSHPQPTHIFQLWQTYISNVNPLLKISHVPTLQSQIIGAAANIAGISKELEVLMFSIYFAAVTSLTDDDARITYGEDRTPLLSKLQDATMQALVNADFMKSTDLIVLQALLLYLLCVQRYTDPRILFSLIGVAVRIGTRLGIHRDVPHHRGTTPFETEMRRRLWWQIVILDKRVAEIIGSRDTALSTCGNDCKFPLNINDTDLSLSIHAKDLPIPSKGPTEMLFCLTRIELIVAAVPGASHRQHAATTPGGAAGGSSKPRVQYSPSPSSPDVVTHMAHQGLPNDLDAFCHRIESQYLQHCDPKIPLHFFTLMMTRQAICKLHVIDALSKGLPSDMESINQAERERLFITAIEMVEYDNIIQKTATISCFRWYTHHHFPFPAYLLLVSELRHRTTGELCERAWSAMIENHEQRGLTRNLRSPMHIAFGHFFIKAWDARAAAEAQLGRVLQEPRIVPLLRNTMRKHSNYPDGPGYTSSQPGHAPGPRVQGGGTSVGGSSTAATASMYSGESPSVGDVSPQMSHAGGGPMGTAAMNETMMYGGGGGYNGMSPMGGGGGGGLAPHMLGQLQDADINQLDWNYLMFGSFNGFDPSQMYMQQQPGPQ